MNINTILSILASIGVLFTLLISCYNRDWEFPDFKYSTAYFPYQYPVRTLILGDYVFDNSNDKQLKFLVSATMGGVYSNENDILIKFEIDESLTDNLFIGDQPVLPLPSSYYTLSNPSEIIIPSGEFSGSVEVQLKEEFLNDPNAIGPIGTHYVLPLRLLSATTDSIQRGMPGMPDADPRIGSEWVIQPQNFTLFGINYVNEYHGRYLKRGVSEVVENGVVIESNIYRSDYVERDEVVEVKTASRNSVVYSARVVRAQVSSPGNFEMRISFDEKGNGTITPTENSPFSVIGTATYSQDTEAWGGKSRDAIYLDYQVVDGTYLHNAKDTLVFRDKSISFQEFTPLVVE